MLALGAFLTSAAVLALAALVVLLRGPNPPSWMTREWAQESMTLVIVFALAFGVGYLGAGAIRAYEAGPSFVDIVLLGVVLVVAVLIWRGFDPRGRLRALHVRPAAGGPAAPVASTAAAHASDAQRAPTEPPSPRPSKPTRRAA